MPDVDGYFAFSQAHHNQNITFLAFGVKYKIFLSNFFFCLAEQGTVSSTQNIKERARMLSDTFDFDVNQAHKIWSFGPEGSGPNMLVDTTFAVQHLQDIRDTVVAGFQWASSEVGFLCS